MHPDEALRRDEQLAGSRWRRFLQSVPGQILANPPVYGLHRELTIGPATRVLEIGCGAGSRLLLLDNRVRFSHGSCAGIEPCERLVRRAGAAFSSNARPLNAILAHPDALPFADASFDIALIDDLLRFLDLRGARATLAEALRVLRPGGRLLAWDLAPPDGRLAAWQRLWLRRHRGRLSTAAALTSLAERAGFAYARPATMRPFFAPPVPRAAVVASVATEDPQIAQIE